jgi:hypothetical protein
MVRQRQASDCVVAALARVVGKSYAAVRRVCGTTRGGLETHEVEWLLGEFGTWRTYRPRREMTAQEWATRNPHARAVLVVESMELASGKVHAVSAVDGVVFDPADGSTSHPGQLLRAYTLVEGRGRDGEVVA